MPAGWDIFRCQCSPKIFMFTWRGVTDLAILLFSSYLHRYQVSHAA